MADPPSKLSYLLSKKEYETEEEARAQQRAVGMKECIEYLLPHCSVY
jgi:hypothetical protein